MKPIYAQENAKAQTQENFVLNGKCKEFLSLENCIDHQLKRRFINRFIKNFLFIGINEIMNKFRGYFVIINEEMMITRYSFHSDIFKFIETILPFLDSLIKCKRVFCIPCNTLMVIK